MTPEDIIDRSFEPQFAGPPLPEFLVEWLRGEAINPVCGDTCIMYVKLELVGHIEGGVSRRIVDARHVSEGCTICQASADILCQNVIGQKIDVQINLFHILAIPIGINRRQCVVTPQRALTEALKCIS